MVTTFRERGARNAKRSLYLFFRGIRGRFRSNFRIQCVDAFFSAETADCIAASKSFILFYKAKNIKTIGCFLQSTSIIVESFSRAVTTSAVLHLGEKYKGAAVVPEFRYLLVSAYRVNFHCALQDYC